MKKDHSIVIALLLASIVMFSSCKTTQMTVSPNAYNSAIDEVDSDITSVGNGYSLTGSGSETKNEMKVTGQSFSKYSGFGTLLDNEYAIYDNFTYTDSVGNIVEFQLKHKKGNDINGTEYVYDVEVINCNCGDKKYFSDVCGEDGIVKKVTNLSSDQQSVFYDQTKTYGAIIGISLGVALLSLLSLLAY